jgi:hypothetical protein
MIVVDPVPRPISFLVRDLLGGIMARKKAAPKMPATEEKTSQARLELPADDMDRVRRAGKSIGLSLSAFIRQAVLEKTVDVEKRMGTK